jgi:purine-binding chemotaxis protein CheW
MTTRLNGTTPHHKSHAHETPAPAAPRAERWVSFELEGQTYGLDVLEVQEILRYPADVTPTPGTPAHVVGVTNLRGNVVTVIDLRKRLGLPAAPITAATRIIVLDLKPDPLGVVVDRIGELLQVMTDAVEPTPAVGLSTAKRPVRGVYSHGQTLVLRLDAASLLHSPHD